MSTSVPKWKDLFSASHFAIGTLLVVPTNLVRNQVAEEVLSTSKVVMGPRVMSFNHLENLLSNELGPAPIDNLARLMTLNATAPDLWEPFKLPGHPAPSRVIELAEQLGDGLDRLRLAGISWDLLETLEPKELTAYLAADGRHYDAWLGDRDDNFTRRSKLLAALKKGQQFKALEEIETIHCSHSKRLSPFEAEFLKALSVQKKVELWMSAPRWLLEEKIPPGSGYHRLRFIRDLEKTASPGLNLIWTQLGDTEDRVIPPALRYASENLFGPTPEEEPPDPTGVLSVMAVPTRYHEVEEVGRKLKALLVKGVPAYRVAVAVPNISMWLPSILDISRRFGLPLHFHQGAPLSSYPPVSALLDLISLWDSDWELPRILKVLESPYFDFNLEGLLRPYLFEIGISDDRAGGGFKVNYEKISDPALKEKLKPVYVALIRLKQAEINLMAAKTWKSFRDRLQSIFRGFGWPGDNVPEPASRGFIYDFWLKTSTEPVSVERLAEVLGHLFDVLIDSQHSPPVGLDSFKLWAGKVISSTTLEVYGGNSMGIKVMNYYDLHGAFFDSLFMLGLNDKVFPSAKAEHCWWPDELVDSLAKTSLGRRLWYSAAENYHREEDIVAQALAQAKQVTISYQTSTADLRPALPSPVVESLLDLFPEGAVLVERPGWSPPQPEMVCEPAELFLSLVLNCSTADETPEIYKNLSNRPADATEANWSSIEVRRKNLNMFQERLPPDLIQAWLSTFRTYQDGPMLSVRPLTSFNDCPRRFWYQDILGLSSWSGIMEAWTSAQQGEVVHKTLERFLAPLITKESRDFGRTRLKYLYWELVHRHYCYKPVGRKPIYDALSKKLETALMAWFDRHKEISKSKVEALEWSFGGIQGNSAPPFRVEAPSGIFYLSGRVDRVDWSGGHVVVRDYKTNRSSYYDQGGNKPQEGRRPSWHYPMVLYALVAQEHFKATADAVIEFVDPREGTDQIIIETGDVSEFVDLWENLLKGELAVPADQNACANCPFIRTCRPHFQVGSVDENDNIE